VRADVAAVARHQSNPGAAAVLLERVGVLVMPQGGLDDDLLAVDLAVLVVGNGNVVGDVVTEVDEAAADR